MYCDLPSMSFHDDRDVFCVKCFVCLNGITMLSKTASFVSPKIYVMSYTCETINWYTLNPFRNLAFLSESDSHIFEKKKKIVSFRLNLHLTHNFRQSRMNNVDHKGMKAVQTFASWCKHNGTLHWAIYEAKNNASSTFWNMEWTTTYDCELWMDKYKLGKIFWCL